MVNSFFWGDPVRAWKENTIQYPLLCAWWDVGNLLNNTTEAQLMLVFSEKMYKDWKKSINDVESDMKQIARHFFQVMNKSPRWQRLGKIKSISPFQSFRSDTGDETAGVQVTLTFTLRDNSGYCDLPIFDYDFDGDVDGTSCSPGSVFNSDMSYNANVDSGGTLELPDIMVTDSDGSTYSSPSLNNIICTPVKVVDSAQIMKTGKTTSYITGDDGYDQAGRNFFNIHTPNVFGNNDRFTDMEGGQDYNTPIIVDWSTLDVHGNVLVYYKNFPSAPSSNLQNAINYCLSLTAGGLEWRMSNFKEGVNICRMEGMNFNYDPINDGSFAIYWTNTMPTSTTAIRINNIVGSFTETPITTTSLKPIPVSTININDFFL